MLKGVNTSGRYIEVMGGTGTNHISRQYSNSHNQGQMMYDLDSQCVKVFDGQNWMPLGGSYATVNMTYQAQTILDWAQRKMAEEAERERLISENKHLQNAWESLKNEQDKFELLVLLSKKIGKHSPEYEALFIEGST